MAKKKELDNLSLDMIRCKADGFGCHYGHWKSLHENTKKEVEEATQEGWCICQRCGKAFKPKARRVQKYCEASCQHEAQQERYREKNRDRAVEYYRRKRAEQAGA